MIRADEVSSGFEGVSSQHSYSGGAMQLDVRVCFSTSARHAFQARHCLPPPRDPPCSLGVGFLWWARWGSKTRDANPSVKEVP